MKQSLSILLLGILALVPAGCTTRQIVGAVVDTAASNAGISMETRRGAEMAYRLGEVGYDYARSHQDISPYQEFYLGRTVAARLFQEYPYYNDPDATDYVTRVGLTLSLVSDRPEVYGGYHFAIVDSESPTAFTCPAGMILIGRGLFDLVESEDELAAVLAHELSHAALKHPLQSIKDVNSIPILSAEALMKLVEDYTSLRRLTKVFSKSVDNIYETLYKSGYKKSYEYEADAMAVLMLQRAGYDPTALERVLKRLPEKEGYSATHPKSKRRIKKITKLLDKQQIAARPVSEDRTQRFRVATKRLR